MDKKKKIELEVLNISNSQEQAGAYALVLGEVEGTRQLPVIIGAAEAQAMLISLKGIIPPRPLTHNLFASCLEVLGVNMMRALIYRVDNGVFYSYIYLKADDAIIRMDARTSDAVAMALRMKAPIFIYEEILEAEQQGRNYQTKRAAIDLCMYSIHPTYKPVPNFPKKKPNTASAYYASILAIRLH